MSKALVLGVAALAISAGAASAQVPGYNYYGATVPLYGYAAPGYGYYAAPGYGYGAAAPLYNYYAAPAYAAPLVGPGYDAPWDYAPGGREWMIEKGW
jgi:hypothetical protein